MIRIGRFLVRTPLGTSPGLETQPRYEAPSDHRVEYVKRKLLTSGEWGCLLDNGQSWPWGSQVAVKKKRKKQFNGFQPLAIFVQTFIIIFWLGFEYTPVVEWNTQIVNFWNKKFIFMNFLKFLRLIQTRYNHSVAGFLTLSYTRLFLKPLKTPEN